MSERIPLALLAAALLLPPAAYAQDWQTVTRTRTVTDENRLEVDVEYGVGRFELRPADAGTLYRANLRYDAADFSPAADYRAGRLQIALQGHDDGVDLRHHEGEGRLELALGPAVLLDLELDFGAVEADLELGGLRLEAVSIATGASETDVRFSRPNPDRCRIIDIDVGAAAFRVHGIGNANAEQFRLDGGLGDIVLDFSGGWRADMSADIDMGLGSLEIRLPRGLGVRISKDAFLASFDLDGFTQRGEAFYSEGWDAAEHQLTIQINAAFGSIDVRWVDETGAVL